MIWGRLRTALGNYEQAHVLLRRSLEASEQALGLQHDYRADILNLLGDTRQLCFYVSTSEPSREPPARFR